MFFRIYSLSHPLLECSFLFLHVFLFTFSPSFFRCLPLSFFFLVLSLLYNLDSFFFFSQLFLNVAWHLFSPTFRGIYSTLAFSPFCCFIIFYSSLTRLRGDSDYFQKKNKNKKLAVSQRHMQQPNAPSKRNTNLPSCQHGIIL